MPDEQNHESQDQLSQSTQEIHRGISSLIEEFEAVDWYQQRIDATKDEALRAILVHNRDEEKEHAAMVLEWLRRKDASLDQQLRRYLFSQMEVTATEDEEELQAAGYRDGSLGIGDLRNRAGQS